MPTLTFLPEAAPGGIVWRELFQQHRVEPGAPTAHSASARLAAGPARAARPSAARSSADSRAAIAGESRNTAAR
jgi:hypothetical protein